jgi:hypothetical protein
MEFMDGLATAFRSVLHIAAAVKKGEGQMTDTDLVDRVAALETRSLRFRLASEGADGWANFVESRVQEESEFLRDVVAHALAGFRNDLIDECKVLIQQALVQRALASRRFSAVLAVEVPVPWRPAANRHGPACADPTNER